MTKHRGGQGVRLIPLEGAKTGLVAAVELVDGDGRRAAAHQRQRPGRAHGCPERQPAEQRRAGVIVMRLHDGDSVAGIAVFRAGLAEQRGIDQNDPSGSAADDTGGDGTPV